MLRRGPFTVRWLDGREETILNIEAWPEYDIVALWARERERGAIGLIDGDQVWRDHNYTEANLASVGLSPGARVLHERTGLLGTVQGYEYQEAEKLSGLPLRVYWDDADRAYELLGWFHIYPDPGGLEALNPVPA